jgi:alpha-ketoglutarate-dependent taurine dioxygenase
MGAMLTTRDTSPAAWTRDTLKPADWTVSLPDACRAELEDVLRELRRSPLPLFMLRPEEFDLGACRALMRRIKSQLDDGIMFAVLDRLPLEIMSRDEATALYWLLASLLARPVAQKLNGQMLFDVRDTGAKLKPGSGIRPTVTNVDLTFHNDNSYNETPPDYVTLLCLHPAKQGGVSRVISVPTVHNALLERHPDLLPRLYQPFWFDRHAEHEPHETNCHAAPLFEYVRKLKGRIALGEIEGDYALRGEQPDNLSAAALGAVQAVFDDPALRVELDFQPGQIQFVNNRSTGHARTDFVDHAEPERQRHLVRLWLRDGGKRGYRG